MPQDHYHAADCNLHSARPRSMLRGYSAAVRA